MDITWGSLLKYLSAAAIEELAERYSAEGWRVQRNAPLARTHADLVARRGDEVIVFEVKAPAAAERKESDFVALQRYVKRHPNASLKVVVVRPPRSTHVDIQGFDLILQELCAERIGQLDLGEIAGNVIIDGVADVDVDEIRVRRGELHVQGSASVDVTLEYGTGADYTPLSDSYPLEFNITLGSELDVLEVRNLEVDVSSFYGPLEDNGA